MVGTYNRYSVCNTVRVCNRWSTTVVVRSGQLGHSKRYENAITWYVIHQRDATRLRRCRSSCNPIKIRRSWTIRFPLWVVTKARYIAYGNANNTDMSVNKMVDIATGNGCPVSVAIADKIESVCHGKLCALSKVYRRKSPRNQLEVYQQTRSKRVHFLNTVGYVSSCVIIRTKPSLNNSYSIDPQNERKLWLAKCCITTGLFV